MNLPATKRLVLIGAAAAMMAACSDDDTAATSGAPTGDSPPTVATNQPSNVRTNAAPTIAGVPAENVLAGTLYQFRPSVDDPEGDALTYAIVNRPPWAAFDRTSGRLQGIPGTADVGTYDDIEISVTDGRKSAALQAFAIKVYTPGSGGLPPLGGSNPRPSLPTDDDSHSGDGSTPFEPAPSQPDREDPEPSEPSNPDQPSDPETMNSAPQLSGWPAASVLADTKYSFTPEAFDADGDDLTFSISNKPSWAWFNSSTGRLQGTPEDEHVGTYSNITIRVSDGKTTVALPSFSIAVEAIALGSATLSWVAPTENEDGTALTDLAGYKVHWGTQPGEYSNTVTIENPGLTTYVIENLVAGTYYFATSAYTTDGLESDFSDEASKTIQ